jgi:hypothetical protein
MNAHLDFRTKLAAASKYKPWEPLIGILEASDGINIEVWKNGECKESLGPYDSRRHAREVVKILSCISGGVWFE